MIMTNITAEPNNLSSGAYYGILWNKRLCNKPRFVSFIWSMVALVRDQYYKMFYVWRKS